MFLAHKIKRAKWESVHGLGNGEIPSHAVTVDLRTWQDNSLSFWKCGTGGEEEVSRAVLALAAQHERLDPMELALVASDDLRADGVTLMDTKGETPVVSLENEHVDAVHLDYARLGLVARRVTAAIAEDHYKKLTRNEVKRILVRALEEGLVDASELADELRGALEIH